MEIGPILRTMWRNKPRSLLIALEVALTLGIVVNCVALILDARKDLTRESGFADEQLVWVRTLNFSGAFEDVAHVDSVFERDIAALRSMPGVQEASSTYFRPWQGGGRSFEVRVEGREEMERARTQFYFVDPSIFETLGVEILAGRGFTTEDYERDDDSKVYPVVISRAFADLLFPDGDALGEVLVDDDERYPIVGIFGPFYNPYGWPIHEYATLFPLPVASKTATGFLVRAEPGRTQEVAGAVEERLLAVDDGRTVSIGTITELRETLQAGPRLMALVLAILIGLVLFVTSLGLVGLTAFAVTERRRQIGTRRALGATRSAIVRHFLVESWLVTTVGAVLGVALAVGLNVSVLGVVDSARVGAALLASGVLLVWLVGLGAALGPALLGARTEPAMATRNV